MDVSVLIPWRTDQGPRERVFRYLLPLWEQTGAQICVGVDDDNGPFNCSRAQNRAFRKAKHNRLFMIGADALPDLDAMSSALQCLSEPAPQWTYTRSGHQWVPTFAETGYYSREATDRILAGSDPKSFNLDYTLPFCTGPVALTRDAYVATGGMDERFSGWGYEDAAFRQTLAGLFGAPPALPYTLRCLWHETDHRITVSPNQVLMNDYTPLTDPVKTQAYLDQRGSFL